MKITIELDEKELHDHPVQIIIKEDPNQGVSIIDDFLLPYPQDMEFTDRNTSKDRLRATM